MAKLPSSLAVRTTLRKADCPQGACVHLLVVLCVVLGAGSRGIGLYTAKHMAALGATVVVASRRIESANAAAAAINSSLGIDRVSGIQLDLASLEVRRSPPVGYAVVQNVTC